jgi:glycosyltransferase involved in cell wall biosynthesis
MSLWPAKCAQFPLESRPVLLYSLALEWEALQNYYLPAMADPVRMGRTGKKRKHCVISAEQPTFAVVIPALDEAATIRAVAEAALRQASRIIVVDDGSVDGTAARLAGLPVVVLRNASTLGKAASLWRGMEHALAHGVDAVITLDGDGQHDPADIARLIAAYRQSSARIVIGARLSDRHKIPAYRYFANRFANFWIAWAAGYPIEDSQSGFRLYPASLLRRVRISHDRGAGFVFESEILIEASRLGVASVAVPVAAIYPHSARPSHFRPVVDILRITRMVAWKLLSRGLHLRGLIDSIMSRPAVYPEGEAERLYRS